MTWEALEVHTRVPYFPVEWAHVSHQLYVPKTKGLQSRTRGGNQRIKAIMYVI